MADESAWLWLTSEQMGFPFRLTGGGEHEERAEDLDSSQGEETMEHARGLLTDQNKVRSLTLFWMKIECAATRILNKH